MIVSIRLTMALSSHYVCLLLYLLHYVLKNFYHFLSYTFSERIFVRLILVSTDCFVLLCFERKQKFGVSYCSHRLDQITLNTRITIYLPTPEGCKAEFTW